MKMASRKDMVFISFILLAAVIFSMVTAGDAIEVGFDTETMSIKSTGFDFTIAYADVEKTELCDTLPEFGKLEKGTDTASLKCGNWNNTIWGDYHLCVLPDNQTCIEITLRDDRIVVFNYKEAEDTEGVFSVLQEYLAK